MPTTVTKTIGTSSRDYSTLQAWEDACPANLVTADQIWRGEAYNDSEFTAQLTIAGQTTDATRYLELTAAAGQSFQDNASVRTNRLDYNQSNGVACTYSGAYGTLMTVNTNYTRISRLQLYESAVNSSNAIVCGGQFVRTKDCIVKATTAWKTDNHDATAINIVSICNKTNNPGMQIGGGVARTTLIGCTTVSINGASSAAAFSDGAYSSASALQSCAGFGFASAINNSARWTTASCFNNATDLASGLPGSSNQHSVSYSATTPFVQSGNTSTDLRAVAATALAGAGYLDATNAPNDISGYARSATPTIGAWELASAPPATGTRNRLALMGVS